MLGTSVTFNYTGAAQTYTVPADVIGLQVDCVGAKGGNGTGYSISIGGTGAGGKGGRVQCTLAVTSGQTLNIFVGGQGGNSNRSYGAAGWNGGAGTENASIGAGGGASDIRIGGTALTDRKIVAGGGGGGSACNISGELVDTYAGGAGGGLTGGNGASGGNGGTQSAGGSGNSTSSTNTGGKNGTLGNGGKDGGGGGYYGGGGGRGEDFILAQGCFAAGGGSSYTDPTLCTDVVHTQGYSSATGNGWIILTPIYTDIYTRDSSKDKTASMPTTTYEAFIAAGYKTDGSVAGVYLKDLNQ